MSRTAITAVALAGTAMALGAAAGTAPTAHAAAHPRRCFTSDLRATLSPFPGGAGQRFAHLRLTNISSHTCTVFGYAGAQLLRADGRRVPTDIVRDHTFAPRLITLRPGRHAAAGWHWTVISGRGESSTGNCEPVARTVEITPPDATTSRRIHWPFGPVCEHGQIFERAFSGPY